jgi:predicted GNAT superfamily acetyltransferase
MQIEIRDAGPEDLEAVLALNEAAVPAVNSVPMAQMEKFLREAAYFRVALVDGAIAGFLVGLTPDADYSSPNFLWFRRHYDDFAYVDRIAIAEHARRFGLGTALYRDFERRLGEQAPRLACEVNLKPPNEPSMRFHERFGFVRVGENPVDGKVVAMLVKELRQERIAHSPAPPV